MVHLRFSSAFQFIYLFQCGMWKFPGQGSNLSHSSNPNHCRDNTRSSTCCSTEGAPCAPILISYTFTFKVNNAIRFVSEKVVPLLLKVPSPETTVFNYSARFQFSFAIYSRFFSLFHHHIYTSLHFPTKANNSGFK